MYLLARHLPLADSLRTNSISSLQGFSAPKHSLKMTHPSVIVLCVLPSTPHRVLRGELCFSFLSGKGLFEDRTLQGAQLVRGCEWLRYEWLWSEWIALEVCQTHCFLSSELGLCSLKPTHPQCQYSCLPTPLPSVAQTQRYSPTQCVAERTCWDSALAETGFQIASLEEFQDKN